MCLKRLERRAAMSKRQSPSTLHPFSPLSSALRSHLCFRALEAVPALLPKKALLGAAFESITAPAWTFEPRYLGDMRMGYNKHQERPDLSKWSEKEKRAK